MIACYLSHRSDKPANAHARKYKEWIEIKTQTKIDTSSIAEYGRFQAICPKALSSIRSTFQILIF